MGKQKKVGLIIGIIVVAIIIVAIAVIATNSIGKNKNAVAMAENKNTVSTTENKNTGATAENKNVTTTNEVIKPLPATLNINSLKDCTFAATFKASDVYLNNDGALVTHMQVMDCEMFDAVDISKMGVGDTLMINGNNMIVKSIEREGKQITINGGLEEGGCYLKTDEDGMFYEILFNDARRYYSIGEVTLPIDQEFTFVDNSDLDNQGKISYAGDFLQEMKNSTREFVANATTVRVENGYIKNITINYIP